MDIWWIYDGYTYVGLLYKNGYCNGSYHMLLETENPSSNWPKYGYPNRSLHRFLRSSQQRGKAVVKPSKSPVDSNAAKDGFES